MGSNNPITSSQVLEDLKSNQVKNKKNKIEMWISKRSETHIKHKYPRKMDNIQSNENGLE